MRALFYVLGLALAFAAPAAAQDMSAFKTGPVFEKFGPHAPVEGATEIPADAKFAIAFDVAKPADEGKANRTFESAARFINMHVAAGVDPKNIKIAVVVHSTASMDLMKDSAWFAREKGEFNPSAAMLSQMLDHGVRFIVCGQSASVYDVSKEDLVPGVEMNLSAMTAHAQLQQQGYTVNPF
jgi:intracellular sulfur oxidation DsrE/DsrF family protein